MCVVNKQFELLENVFYSVYVELKYDYIFLLDLCPCDVSVVMPWSVRLSRYSMLMPWLL